MIRTWPDRALEYGIIVVAKAGVKEPAINEGRAQSVTPSDPSRRSENGKGPKQQGQDDLYASLTCLLSNFSQHFGGNN